MKKLLSVLASLTMVLGLVGCSNSVDYSKKDDGVMTYAEYEAAATDGSVDVVIEAYVQASQSYYNGATLYLADTDGAYFVYNGQISEADWAKCVKDANYGTGWYGEGTGIKVKVSGTKTEWAGEVEIADATVEIVDDSISYIAPAIDVTALFNDESLSNYNNRLVTIKGLIVAASEDQNGNAVAFLYNWDGSGEDGSDLYFNVTDGYNTYTYVVESYLAFAGSEVYETVKGLSIGDTVDLEGFLYWYNGPQMHVTRVTK